MVNTNDTTNCYLLENVVHLAACVFVYYQHFHVSCAYKLFREAPFMFQKNHIGTEIETKFKEKKQQQCLMYDKWH